MSGHGEPSTTRRRRRRADVVAGLRGIGEARRSTGAERRRRSGAPRSAATSAASACPPSTTTCSSSTSGGSSAPARPAGRCARATRSSGRRARAIVWLDDFELPDELWARVRDPDRARVLHAQQLASGAIVALYPSPAGATESELDLGGLGATCATPTRVLESLEPDAEALIVNRIASRRSYVIAPIDECYRLVGADQGRAGRGSPAATRSSARSPTFFERAAAALGRSHERARAVDGAALASAAAGGRGRHGGARRAETSAARRAGLSSVSAPRDRARRRADARASRLRRRATLRAARSSRSRCRVQIQIEPAKRTLRRRDDARTLVELFGDPSAGRDDAQRCAGRSVDVLVPAFTRRTDGRDRGALHLRPRGRGGQVLLLRAGRRGAARASTSTARVFYRGDGRAPADRAGPLGHARPTSRCRSTVWKEMIDSLLPGPRLGAACTATRSTRCSGARRARARRRFDAASPSCSRGRAAMNSAIEELVRSLLYEGYALYPYTPGATKNATPTPFGIVYPPAYAEAQPGRVRPTLRLEAVLAGRPRRAAQRHASCFLQATGERHEAAERVARARPGDPRQSWRAAPFARPSASRSTRRASCAAGSRCAPSCSRRRSPGSASASTTRPRCRAIRPRSRGDALRHSLISTHPLLEVEGGRFVSPLERQGRRGRRRSPASVNTFPVLLGDEDGGPRRGDRAARPPGARAGEPRQPVRQHRDRGGAAAPRAGAVRRRARGDRRPGPGGAGDDRAGRVDHAARRSSACTAASTSRSPRRGAAGDQRPPAGAAARTRRGPGGARGRRRGTTVRLGDKIVLRPGTEGDVYDQMLARAHARRSSASTSTTTSGVYLGVTVDDDPGQDLLRETGRYLFFFADEVEPVSR